MSVIRFKFAPAKARAALHWMVSDHPGIDLHAALKACYFADKEHLNRFHRPVFGATYRAMKFGPVPVEIYEMAKGEALWLAELDADQLPWRMEGFRLRLCGNTDVDRASLSASDQEAIEHGIQTSLSMNFSERTAATHGPDWQAAQLGTMRYEDMLVDGPDKHEIIAYLQENARFMRL
jgi:hypothetical protein